MQHVLPPVASDIFRQYDRNRVGRTLLVDFVDVLEQRCDQRTIRRLDDHELNVGSELGPAFTNTLDRLLVVIDMNRGHVLGNRARIGQRLTRDPVDVRDRHDNRVLDLFGIERCLRGELTGRGEVVPVDRAHHEDQQHDHNHDYPGAFGNLRDRDDRRHNRGGDRADKIDDPAGLPPRFAAFLPSSEHAELGDRKRGKNAKRVKWNQLFDFALFQRQNEARDKTKRHDAGRVRQTIAAKGELAWHVPVARQEIREPWKVGVGGIRGQNEDGHRCELDVVIPGIPPRENLSGHLRDNRFVTRVGRFHRVSAVLVRQESNSAEHDR